MTTAAGTTRRDLLVRTLAITSVVAAVIHFAVAGEHFQEYWAFGVFMLVTAWLQLVWAAAVTLRPTGLVLAAGAVLNAGVVAVYVVTRTVGDVVGPTPHELEPVGFGDAFCTACEALVVVGALVLLARRATARLDAPVPAGRLTAVTAAAGLVAAVLLSVVLVDGGSEMVMGGDSDAADAAPTAAPAAGSAMAGMHMGTVTAAVSLPTATPGGKVAMPNPNMQMEAGMQMAGPACTSAPTKAQQAATVALVNATWRADRRFQSLAAAKAAGYAPVTPTGHRVVHYVNAGYYAATMHGTQPVLDTAAPQSLVYANTPHGAVLVAAMYIAPPRDPRLPSPGGCLTQWHVHTNLCLAHGQVVGVTQIGCPAASQNSPTPAMFHVWFAPVPGGPTAVDASNSDVVHAAEQVSSPPNGTA